LGTVKVTAGLVEMTPFALVVLLLPDRGRDEPLNVAERVVELAPKPLPVTVTVEPLRPVDGVNVIAGVTVKLTDAALRVSTVTTTAYVPARLPGAVLGIVNVGGVVVGMPPVAVVVVEPDSVAADPL
jgi:hypothetical protein